MDRIQQLQDTHPWLSEDKARFILLTRYWVFTRELDMSGETLEAAMNNAVTIYKRLPEDAMRDMVARFEEKYVTS